MSSKIALLIDAENMSYQELPDILKEVRRHGQVVLQAVYGDWTQPNLQNWHDLARKHAFKIRHQNNIPDAKNAADMKLIMDAMEVLYHVPVDMFCLVTNDSDYIPLCEKIRESQKYVIGVGYEHASEALIRSCDQFIFIRREQVVGQLLNHTNGNGLHPNLLAEQANPKTLKRILCEAFASLPQNPDQWVTLSELGSALQRVREGFKPNHYGYTTLTNLLEDMPDFVEYDGNGNGKSVRCKDTHRVAQLKQNEAQRLLVEAFPLARLDQQEWVTLSALGSALRQVKDGFKPNHYGHANLTKLLESMPKFVQVETRDKVKSARLL